MKVDNFQKGIIEIRKSNIKTILYIAMMPVCGLIKLRSLCPLLFQKYDKNWANQCNKIILLIKGQN